MDSNKFYKDNVCIIPSEGRSLFVKQGSGIKFAKVGAVLFSDIKNSITLENVLSNFGSTMLAHG